MAVAAAILTAIYWMLTRGEPYHDLGPDHFDKTHRSRLALRIAKKLHELGFEVAITERALV